MHIKPSLFPVIIIVGLAQGCSFSASSQSSSDSSASISESSGSILSSPSSSSSQDDENYQIQVMSYTSAFLTTTTFNRFSFSKGITQIATANGITNWEDDDPTLRGIGRALKQSHISGSTYESYKENIANSDDHRMQMIQKGYDKQKN